MIDIHCHPLSGVDDGAETFEISVAMCKMAAEDGITHLVATPHCNYSYEFSTNVNREKAAELQAAVGDVPKLLLGCDFHLSFDNIRHLIDHRKDYTINQTAYVLVELSEHFIPEQFDRVFYDIQLAGLTPIVTHPERNTVVARKPELVYHWATRGCLIQVTAQSFTGHFGRSRQLLADEWFDRNLIHFFATDAHDAKGRPPILSRCYQKIAATKGQQMADLLLRQNPGSVIQGKPLPPAPEPIKPREVKQKRSWLSFFGLQR